jgi:hypothetical protein
MYDQIKFKFDLQLFSVFLTQVRVDLSKYNHCRKDDLIKGTSTVAFKLFLECHLIFNFADRDATCIPVVNRRGAKSYGGGVGLHSNPTGLLNLWLLGNALILMTANQKPLFSQ